MTRERTPLFPNVYGPLEVTPCPGCGAESLNWLQCTACLVNRAPAPPRAYWCANPRCARGVLGEGEYCPRCQAVTLAEPLLREVAP
jgi:hypothetical protein